MCGRIVSWKRRLGRDVPCSPRDLERGSGPYESPHLRYQMTPMPVFHAPIHCTSHSERGDRALARLVEQVNALRARPVMGEGFEAMERELRALFAEAEREVVGETLERLDVDLPYVEMEGQRYRRVLRSHATYTSAAGAVGVHRTLHRHGRERAVVPMDLRAGRVAGHWTELAARQASVVVVHVTPQEGERVFGELGGMRPSKSSLPGSCAKRRSSSRCSGRRATSPRTRGPDGRRVWRTGSGRTPDRGIRGQARARSSSSVAVRSWSSPTICARR